MLSLKDIYRHFGRRKTFDVLVRINSRQELTSSCLPVVEDLAYIGLVRRGVGTSLELTDTGSSALAALEAELGSLVLQA